MGFPRPCRGQFACPLPGAAGPGMPSRMPRFSLIAVASLALLLIPRPLLAAASSSLEAEYQQVRKIALRDPKVRAAYAEADRRLEAKIVQIDPALAAYVRTRDSQAAAPKPAAKKAAPTPAPKAATSPTVYRRSHVVAKGETLSGIAVRYGVTVAVLKDANKIADEKKLVVGQVLAIPGGKAPVKTSAKKLGAWEQIKGAF